MTTQIREFGVRDPNAYWRNRQTKHKIGERRVHKCLASLVDRLAEPGSHVLDCGAGEGHVSRRCSRRYRVHVAELSTEAIRGYDFPIESAHQVDLNDGMPDFSVLFQVIVASCILHWLDKPEAFLKQAESLLAPGGRLVVNIPNITHIKYRFQFLFGRFPEISPSHKNFQTPHEFEAMVRQCGFRIEQRVAPKPIPHVQLWPNLFSHALIYVLAPFQSARC